MNFFQPIIFLYYEVTNAIPKDILYISFLVLFLFLLLIILKLLKVKNHNNKKAKAKNNSKLLETEKKLQALKNLYEQGHIDIKTYKEKAIEISKSNYDK